MLSCSDVEWMNEQKSKLLDDFKSLNSIYIGHYLYSLYYRLFVLQAVSTLNFEIVESDVRMMKPIETRSMINRR